MIKNASKKRSEGRIFYFALGKINNIQSPILLFLTKIYSDKVKIYSSIDIAFFLW